jgi:hypothetical protein
VLLLAIVIVYLLPPRLPVTVADGAVKVAVRPEGVLTASEPLPITVCPDCNVRLDEVLKPPERMTVELAPGRPPRRAAPRRWCWRC